MTRSRSPNYPATPTAPGFWFMRVFEERSRYTYGPYEGPFSSSDAAIAAIQDREFRGEDADVIQINEAGERVWSYRFLGYD